MKQTRLLMGMPITVAIEDPQATAGIFDQIYAYFAYVDETYSTYKPTSEVSRINAGLPRADWSAEMNHVLALCEQTKAETKGYFNVWRHGRLDPSGLVKGWAIDRAAAVLRELGFRNFYVEAGGDIQVSGHNAEDQPWRVGIRSPFDREHVVKVVATTTEGVATSGTYIRGQHIYNPLQDDAGIRDVASLTVIGPNIYEADRFATAAFAMGLDGIQFIESLAGLEGYQIDQNRQATYTTGFERYVVAA
jgi:thiamine biosynthesis lipoprotein